MTYAHSEKPTLQAAVIFALKETFIGMDAHEAYELYHNLHYIGMEKTLEEAGITEEATGISVPNTVETLEDLEDHLTYKIGEGSLAIDYFLEFSAGKHEPLKQPNHSTDEMVQLIRIKEAAEKLGVAALSVKRAMKVTEKGPEFSACYSYALSCASGGKTTHEMQMAHAEKLYKHHYQTQA